MMFIVKIMGTIDRIIQELSDRRRRIDARRESRHGSSWIIGLIMLVAGIFILLQNFTTLRINNWWSLFIMIPALGAFANAWRVYRKDGRLAAPARTSLISGILLTLITAVFLFNWNWIVLGPVILLLAGFAIILNTLL